VTRSFLLLALVVAAAAVGLTGTALGSSNTVPGTKVTRFVTAITANTLKPSSCSAITLTKVVAGVTGTAGADLLLGSAGVDTMTAAGGNDCVLGGGSNDAINCGAGTDVAIGGPGTDTFSANCETQIQ
jgi:Ca2+-binding RTX toxin-like protein